jgi:F-type H+-transporting ATPase subunit delta
MKVTNDQYAKLLFEAHETSDDKERRALLKGIANLIKENGDQAKLGDIESRYYIIRKRESGQLEGTVYTAKKITGDVTDKIRKAIAKEKEISAKLIELKNEVDSEMKGGFIVKFDNEIYDGSLDNKIAKVKKALVE